MQPLIEYGVSLIIAIQNLGDWLVVPMRIFSYLGNEEFFFLVLPLIYWSIDASLGLRVGFILITSNFFNYIGKLAFAGPRPYWVSSHVKGLWSETSFGIPSGHAQNAMSVWGIIAFHIRKRWAWIAAGVLIFFIGFSRLVLGTHFPHDVLAGWIIGGLLLVLFIRLSDPIVRWFKDTSTWQQVLYAFLVSLIMIGIGFSAVKLRSDFKIPDSWILNAQLAGNELPNPVDPNDIFTSAGTFFGLAVGVSWITSLGGYHVSGPAWKRGVRYLVGLVGVLVFWMGLGELLPRGDGLIFYTLRYLRYGLVGWWVSGGAPWLFKRLRLTG